MNSKRLKVFGEFVVDPEKGYIPTDKALKEAVEEMKENEDTFDIWRGLNDTTVHEDGGEAI